MSSCSMLAACDLHRAGDCRPADAELQQNLCFLLVGIVYRAQAAPWRIEPSSKSVRSSIPPDAYSPTRMTLIHRFQNGSACFPQGGS